MGIIYGVPPVQALPPVDPWRGTKLTLDGWNGAEFNLSDPSSGIFLMKGIRGLGLPTFERKSTSSPMVAGSRHRGTSTKDREVFWPIYIYSDSSSAEFIARDRAFWEALDTDIESLWTSTLPDGSKRTLGVKLIGGDDDQGMDPVARGWTKYAVNLIADQPYWAGQTMRQSWSAPELRNYYVTAEDRATYGYSDDVIHYLSSGGSLDGAVFSNPGDVPAYPVWSVTGPTTAVEFGIGDRRVKVPFAIPEGYAVQIDMNPVDGQVLWYGQWSIHPDTKSVVIADPVDRTKELDPSSAFVPIPSGQDRKLSFAMTGTGTIAAEVRPRYWKAF